MLLYNPGRGEIECGVGGEECVCEILREIKPRERICVCISVQARESQIAIEMYRLGDG